MKTEHVQVKKNRYSEDPEAVIYATKGVHLPGRIAVEIARSMSMPVNSTYERDGTVFKQSPEDIAERACAVADSLCSKFEARGWVFDIPVPPDEPQAPPDGQPTG